MGDSMERIQYGGQSGDEADGDGGCGVELKFYPSCGDRKMAYFQSKLDCHYRFNWTLFFVDITT